MDDTLGEVGVNYLVYTIHQFSCNHSQSKHIIKRHIVIFRCWTAIVNVENVLMVSKYRHVHCHMKQQKLQPMTCLPFTETVM